MSENESVYYFRHYMIFLTFLNRFFHILGSSKYSDIRVLVKRKNLEYIKNFLDIFPIVWFYKKDLDTLTRNSIVYQLQV